MFSQIWPSVAVSVVCALSFVTAIGLGWRLPSLRSQQAQASEARTIHFAVLGGALLVLATVLWLVYLVLGPVHDAISQINETADW